MIPSLETTHDGRPRESIGDYNAVMRGLDRIKGPIELTHARAIIQKWWGEAPNEIRDQVTMRGMEMLCSRIAVALAEAWHEGHSAGRP